MLLFSQGTQSANPHNDYCQHFVDSGERPQNFIHDLGSYVTYNVDTRQPKGAVNKQRNREMTQQHWPKTMVDTVLASLVFVFVQ